MEWNEAESLLKVPVPFLSVPMVLGKLFHKQIEKLRTTVQLSGSNANTKTCRTRGCFGFGNGRVGSETDMSEVKTNFSGVDTAIVRF